MRQREARTSDEHVLSFERRQLSLIGRQRLRRLLQRQLLGLLVRALTRRRQGVCSRGAAAVRADLARGVIRSGLFAFASLAVACGSGDIVADVDGQPSGVDAGPYDPDANPSADAASHDAAPPVDTDGDGLDDAWEEAAGDPGLLDPFDSDSDGDGTKDGDEDYDGDGLTNLEELALGRLATAPPGRAPDPFRVDLPVELDAMAGRYLPNSVLADAMEAFEALPTEGASGRTGVGLLIYRDEITIMAEIFDDNASIMSFLAAHGPQFDDSDTPPIPYDKLVHVAVVTRRNSTPTTPASTVFDVGGADPEATGAVIFEDVIEETHPACDGDITVDAARVASLVHELGHVLQLGHDTDVGGAINHYNIMSLATDCTEASMRFLGTGNDDETLGNTESVASSRFSWAAASLMQFENKLSVDTAVMVDVDGVEM